MQEKSYVLPDGKDDLISSCNRIDGDQYEVTACPSFLALEASNISLCQTAPPNPSRPSIASRIKINEAKL